MKTYDHWQRKKKQQDLETDDATLLLDIEDLIHISMGSSDQNLVNFKMLQTVLYILARHMRLLQQQVEVREEKFQQRRDAGSSSERKSTDSMHHRKLRRRSVHSKANLKGSPRHSRKKEKGGQMSQSALHSDKSDHKDKGKRSRGGTYSDSEDEHKKERGKGKGTKDDVTYSPRSKSSKSKRSERDEDDEEDDAQEGGRGRDKSKERKRENDSDREQDSRGSKDRKEDRSGKGGRRESAQESEIDEDTDRGSRKGDKRKGRSGKEGGAEKSGRVNEDYDEDENRGGGGKGRSAGKTKEGKTAARDRREREEDQDRGGEGKGTKGKKGEGRGSDKDRSDRQDEDREIGKGGKGRKGESGAPDRDRRDREEYDEDRNVEIGKKKSQKDDKKAYAGKKSTSAKTKERDINYDEDDDESREKREKGIDEEGGNKKRGKGTGKEDRVKGSKDQAGGRRRESQETDEEDEEDSKDARKRSGKDEEVGKGKGGKRGDEEGGKGRKRKDVSEEFSREKGGKAKKRPDEEHARGREDSDEDIETEKKGKKGTKTSKTSITVSEVSRGEKGEKVLVVEKISRPAVIQPIRVGSVEVVSQKQFQTLESVVRILENKASLPPPPTLPDNKKLRSDIAKGNASLTDTMQAMQLSARVQAAEKGVQKMAELLEDLAASGALPKDIAGTLKSNAESAKRALKSAETVKQGTGFGGQGGPQAGGAGGHGGQYGGSGGQQTSHGGQYGGARGQGGHGGGQYEGQGGQYSGQYKESGGHQGDLESQGGQEEQFTDIPGGQGHAARHFVAGPSSAPNKLGGSGGVAGLANMGGLGPVTQATVESALDDLRDEIFQNLTVLSSHAAATADAAAKEVKEIGERMDTVMKLNSRVTNLQSLANDCSEQLAGFDKGLGTQILGFQEQVALLRNDLSSGLHQLEQVNNNAETAAVLELSERYESLVLELENTLQSHQTLTSYQRQLSDELRNLIEAVEMMREQKADRDEVLDGLKDKADSSRLAGLLSEAAFAKARDELEHRMEMCYDKFRKQDAIWMSVMHDYSIMMDNKAEVMHLLAVRDDAQEQLRALTKKTMLLEKLLGDPKAALITRKLGINAFCGPCRVPALMDALIEIQPPRLPELRLVPTEVSAEPESIEREICLRAREECHDGDFKKPPHMCQRWVGGSHTLIGPGLKRGNVSHEQAPPSDTLHPVKKYLGAGTDGRLYKLEEDMEPCVTCKPKVSKEEKIPGEADLPSPEDGGGDQASKPRPVDGASARRVTIIDENLLEQARETPDLAQPRRFSSRPRFDQLAASHPRLSIRDNISESSAVNFDRVTSTMPGEGRRSEDISDTSTIHEEDIPPPPPVPHIVKEVKLVEVPEMVDDLHYT